ncbi:MAG: hypothetical protein Kow0013_04330 [Pararhodobacter sp.]
MRRVEGMHMLDYSRYTLTNGQPFDLLSLHYFHRLNDWLHIGVGAFAPMFQGNAGGFYGADVTLHAQRRIAGNWFANAGLALGAGAGGSSIANIRRLSGDGLFARAYAGIGYRLRNGMSIGLNYSRVTIANSQIDDGAVNLFMQRPFARSIGAYDDAGRTLGARDFDAPGRESILSFNLSHMAQINPTGRYRGDIGLASVQYSHFFSRDFYSFFGVDIGVTGLHWYNQAEGGVGYRLSLTETVNLYGQIGIGSGGWVTSHVNTGPGFVIYPKVTLEYLWRNGIGATVSAGYFHAPQGTSRNWTLGIGLNYHLSHDHRRPPEAETPADYRLRGVRLHVMGRVTSPIAYNGRRSDGISMIAVQVDYALNEHWYLAGQMAASATAFRGYAGYAEGFVGLGWQSRPVLGGRVQGYAQVMYGLNDVGVSARHEVGPILYPAIGVNYHLNDRLSLYGQMGAALSLGRYFNPGSTVNFHDASIGFGLTYRFSLPTRN